MNTPVWTGIVEKALGPSAFAPQVSRRWPCEVLAAGFKLLLFARTHPDNVPSNSSSSSSGITTERTMLFAPSAPMTWRAWIRASNTRDKQSHHVCSHPLTIFQRHCDVSIIARVDGAYFGFEVELGSLVYTQVVSHPGEGLSLFGSIVSPLRSSDNGHGFTWVMKNGASRSFIISSGNAISHAVSPVLPTRKMS